MLTHPNRPRSAHHPLLKLKLNRKAEACSAADQQVRPDKRAVHLAAELRRREEVCLAETLVPTHRPLLPRPSLSEPMLKIKTNHLPPLLPPLPLLQLLVPCLVDLEATPVHPHQIPNLLSAALDNPPHLPLRLPPILDHFSLLNPLSQLLEVCSALHHQGHPHLHLLVLLPPCSARSLQTRQRLEAYSEPSPLLPFHLLVHLRQVHLHLLLFLPLVEVSFRLEPSPPHQPLPRLPRNRRKRLYLAHQLQRPMRVPRGARVRQHLGQVSSGGTCLAPSLQRPVRPRVGMQANLLLLPHQQAGLASAHLRNLPHQHRQRPQNRRNPREGSALALRRPHLLLRQISQLPLRLLHRLPSNHSALGTLVLVRVQPPLLRQVQRRTGLLHLLPPRPPRLPRPHLLEDSASLI